MYAKSIGFTRIKQKSVNFDETSFLKQNGETCVNKYRYFVGSSESRSIFEIIGFKSKMS